MHSKTWHFLKLNVSVDYGSNKAGGAGESISSVLPAGKYTLTLTDNTDYSGETLMSAEEVEQLILNVGVGINIKPYTTQKIEGRISIPESGESMPVSMGVAEFVQKDDGTYERKEFGKEAINSLNPNKPVWVGIHGMNGHEDDARIDGIAQELYAYGDQAGQVVTINWEIAAQDITRTGQDAPWTKSVGEWVGQQIVAAGFSPDKVHFYGHSHGTYVSFSAASEIMRLKGGLQVNTIVALDPAGNVKALSGFDDGDIRFDSVSRNSVAIEGSWIAGSNQLAATADIAFQVDSEDTHFPWQEHGLPITTFSSILHSERFMPGQYPQALTLESLMTPISEQSMQMERNIFRGNYEGIITIDTVKTNDKYGNYYVALPRKIEWGNPNSDLNIISYINNVDATITQP
ncbi:hypothetical protein KJ652_04470 [Patescibacteria group bacterium]|nr:hypothetical protein [Patescibacteria group bacterium]MBU1123821.1 hypothetical protein [Patescibacteria group bacterium]